MKNWIVTAVALGLGFGITVALLVYTNPSRTSVEVYALVRSVDSGELIAPDALQLRPVVISGGATSLYRRGEEGSLEGARAAHDLFAGQLLQRSDVAAAQTIVDERLVFVPVKQAPPAVAGDRLDLFMLDGAGESPSVVPFALGVEVRAVVTGGFVVAVPSKQATAFVYAAETMNLVAVVAAPDAQTGSESPISTPDQALAAVAPQ